VFTTRVLAGIFAAVSTAVTGVTDTFAITTEPVFTAAGRAADLTEAVFARPTWITNTKFFCDVATTMRTTTGGAYWTTRQSIRAGRVIFAGGAGKGREASADGFVVSDRTFAVSAAVRWRTHTGPTGPSLIARCTHASAGLFVAFAVRTGLTTTLRATLAPFLNRFFLSSFSFFTFFLFLVLKVQFFPFGLPFTFFPFVFLTFTALLFITFPTFLAFTFFPFAFFLFPFVSLPFASIFIGFTFGLRFGFRFGFGFGCGFRFVGSFDISCGRSSGCGGWFLFR